MSKKFLLILTLSTCLSTWLLQACEESEPIEKDTAQLNFSSTEVSFDYLGGTTELSVMANGIWTVRDTSNWLTVSGDSVPETGTLTLLVEENLTYESRNTHLIVSVRDTSTTIPVTQQGIDLGPLVVAEGNESFTFLENSGAAQIFEISNCGDTPGTNSHNIVLMSAETDRIVATWNHINSTSGEWEGIARQPSDYNISDQPNGTDAECSGVQTFNSILVKKYGDWDHQHANGYILNLADEYASIESLDHLILDIYYDSTKTTLPSFQDLVDNYGGTLDQREISEWDDGKFYFDIQLHTNKSRIAVINLTIEKQLANQWLRVEVPIEDMTFWNSSRTEIGYNEIAKDLVREVSLTAETKSRAVYRNLDMNGFNADTPKLFKEIAIRIKRFEIERKEL